MKKWIAMFLIPLILAVSACAEDPSGCENDEHAMEIIQNIFPTCTEPGFCIEKCSLCGIEVTTSLPPFGHTPENIPGCEPTETAEGQTPGVRCAVCTAILQEPQIIPKLETSETSSSEQVDPPTEEPVPEPVHTEIVDPSVPPEAQDTGTPVPPAEPLETESTLPPAEPLETESTLPPAEPQEMESTLPSETPVTEPPSGPVETSLPDIVYFTEEPAPSPAPIEEPARETASSSVETSSPNIVYFTEEPVSSPAPDTAPPVVYFTEAPSITAAPAAETVIPQNQPSVSSVQEAPQNTDTKASDEKAPSSPSSSRAFTSMELILLPEGKTTSLVLLVTKPDEGSGVSFFLRLWLVTSDGIAMELQPGSCEILMDGSALISDKHFMHFNSIELIPEVPAENWMNCSFIHYNGQPAFTLSDSFFRLQLPPETLETVDAYLGENTTLKCLAGQVESSAE